MAQVEDPGTFEVWVTDRIFIDEMHPAHESTGDFEDWLWDRGYWRWYVEWPTRVLAPTYLTNIGCY